MSVFCLFLVLATVSNQRSDAFDAYRSPTVREIDNPEIELPRCLSNGIGGDPLVTCASRQRNHQFFVYYLPLLVPVSSKRPCPEKLPPDTRILSPFSIDQYINQPRDSIP